MFYYSDDGEKSFSSKIEAINYDKPCFFYYFDKEFEKIDWHIEPKKDLNTLYRERAEQLRKDYDYLILAYSGGADSHNILETFYNNGIHIDEILMVGAFSQDSEKGSDENHNGEIYHMAYPTVNSLKLPNTKITLYDYTTLFNNIQNFSLVKEYGDEWIMHIGSYYSVHHLFWRDLNVFLGDKNGKKTAVVFGIEKPNYHWDYTKQSGFTMFGDLGFAHYGNYTKKGNYEKVNFYSDPNTGELMRKQLHTINNFFIENVIVKKTITFEFFYLKYSDIIHKLIYDNKLPIIFKSPKSKTNILSLRDSYLINKKNSDIFDIYKQGIKKVPMALSKQDKKIDSFFAIESFITRRYYLNP